MSTTTTVAGGAWYEDINVCRSAYRDDRHPGDRFDNLSLRLALDTVQPDRTIKSGSWFNCRSAYRNNWDPTNRDYKLSFRLALISHYEPGDRDGNVGLRLALTASIEP